MKKLLSVVLTIAMLASIVSIPVAVGAQSYPVIDLSSGFVADNSFSNNLIESAVYGIAGKDASDESLAVKENVNTWTSWYQYDHGEEIYLENGKPMEGYLVAELNFMAPDAEYLAEYIFGLSTNQARMTINPTNKLIENTGKWNHLRMVYWADETNCDFTDFENNVPNADSRLGSTLLYLNGKEIGRKDITCTANQFDKPIDCILFEIYSKDKTVQHITYFDDIKVYKSDVNPGAQNNAPIAEASGYTVTDGTIILNEGASVSVADIAGANSGYEITAFTGSDLISQLEDEAILAAGNYVAAKSPDGVYAYYSVSDASTTILFEESDGGFASGWYDKMNQSEVSGVAGKALTDKSVLFTTEMSTFDGNMMINKADYYTKSKNYFVMEANINPVDGDYDMASLSVHTNSHAVVGGAINLSAGKWSKYLLYVDFTGVTPKAYTYVNGTLVKENDAAASFGSKSTVRMCFNGSKENPQQFSVYVDDFRIYETNNKPDGIAETTLPVPASSGIYSVSKGKLNVLQGVTAADVKAVNPNARIYTDLTCTAYASDDAVMDNGMVFALDGDNSSVSMYPVVISYGEVEIDLRTGDSGAAFPSVVNGIGELVDGFAGKDASDKVLAVTANTDTHIALKSWGTVVKTGADNSITPTWSKSDYNGYLIVEASVFNIDNTIISLVTTQTGQVSGNIASVVPKNEWARVKFIYNAVDGNANEGKTIAYVNGKAVTGWVNSVFGQMAAYATNNYMRNDIRISMKGSTSGVAATYIDDIRVYEIPSLRIDEKVTFTCPEGSYAIGGIFSAPEDVSVEQIKAVNPDVTVKVFNNKTDYEEITDSSAYLADGNVIFVSDRSQSTIDAGFGYDDMFTVLTVGDVSPVKDIITSVPSGVNRGSISDVSGAFENIGDVKKITDENTSDSNWYFAHSYKGITEGMKYLVFEVDFASEGDIADFYFGANQHAGLSVMAKPENGIMKNRWNKIVMVYDVASDTSDMYINGTQISDDFEGNYAEKMAANNGTIDLRVVVDCKKGSVSYIDTYKLYESAIYPEIAQPAKLTDGYENRILANYASATADINEDVTVAEVASGIAGGTAYAFEDSTCEVLMDNSDTFSDGNVLVLRTDDNMFTVYNVTTHKSDMIIASGDTYDGAGNMTTGTLGLYAPVRNGGVLYAAQYDADGRIIKIASDDTVENSTLEIIFETEEIDKSKVKAFLFESSESLKPICTELEIGVRDYINFLILGNSYSMDVTWHLRQIAAADDVLMNVCVLNKGGCHLRYHYDNREGDPAELGINFWKNNKVLGTVYNLEQTLEKFDWDYVAIQASSTSKGLDDVSEENYQENWAVAVPFAQYIHEMEPDARLVIHSTWSMENGYNFVDSVETRDTIMANVRALNNRCADEINSTLGLEGDDQVLIICSTDIIDAARNFAPEQDITINGRTCAAGTKMFDTTYYKNGHVFTFTEANVRDVVVGDGTMLLGDEDRESGKISLHRDGFHMSALGRYLIALNAYATITGNKVTGNTFDSFDETRADGKIRLDSSPGGLHITETDTNKSSTVYQIYDVLSPEVRRICQDLVDNINR